MVRWRTRSVGTKRERVLWVIWIDLCVETARRCPEGNKGLIRKEVEGFCGVVVYSGGDAEKRAVAGLSFDSRKGIVA